MNAAKDRDVEREMQRVFAQARQVTGSNAADRARISEKLRSQLGASVLDGRGPATLAPDLAPRRRELEPTGSAGRASIRRVTSIRAVVASGVVMGALGLVVGYGLGRRDQPAPQSAAVPPTPMGVREAPPEPQPTPQHARLEPAPESPSSANAKTAPARSRARPSARASRPESVAAATLGFSEVVERLRRANRALQEEQGTLALIQLSELDRLAGETLREEREVTRVLALCAVGDEVGARTAAASLRASARGSIYARRIASSCAGEAPE